MHPGQLSVGRDAVARLVADQFPPWSDLPVVEVAGQGTVNALFRIGDRLAARFPLLSGDVEATRRWLAAEAEAAQELLGRTPFPTPEPVALGEPGEGFPLPWAVQTWLPGASAIEVDPDASTEFARDAWVQTCLDRSGALFDVESLRRRWARLRELPRTDADTTTHGDLTSGNVLVRVGRLAGVIDVGGLGPADPALDLVSAWHLLEAESRWALREALACDDLTWERGRAWAFEQALGLAWYYVESNPAMSAVGRRTIARIMADPPA